MEDKSSIAHKVQKLMNSKGIARRKQASTMAEILGIKYNSAKQKLDKKRGISINEAKKVFAYFNDTYMDARDYNCVFITKDVHKRCNIETDEFLTNIPSPNDTYASKKNNCFIIDTNTEDQAQNNLYKVNKIEFSRSPKLAILDNDKDILNLLDTLSSRYGIDTYTFTNKKEIIEAIKNQDFDCYILDWLLDFGETSESIIIKIRETSKKHQPIIILTGQLDQHEKLIGDVIIKYGVELIEKPTRGIIISSLLLSILFFQDNRGY